MPSASERLELVKKLLSEGYTSPLAIANVLKESHGICVHRVTVARDMGKLSTPNPRGTMTERYESRVQDLTDMLEDNDLTSREKLAVHRTLNETEGKLVALKARVKEDRDVKSWDTPEARREFIATREKWFALNEVRRLKRREDRDREVRADVYRELRDRGVEIDV
jgi:tRNA splicing endonuclease